MGIQRLTGKRFGIVLAVLIIGSIFVWSAMVQEPLRAPSLSPAQLAHEAFIKCDALAADGDDPSRIAAPVPNERFAPGEAIAACRDAVRLNPENATSLFELGRSLWVAKQDQAFKYFVDSAALGYPIAEKYLGDAYMQQRVPVGIEASASQAEIWYQKADDAGITSAHDLLLFVRAKMRRESFDLERDRTLFSSPEYLEALWTGDFENVQSPIGLTYYAQGLTKTIDSNNAIFLDPTCHPLVNSVGSIVMDYAQVIAVAKSIIDSQNLTPEERKYRIARAAADLIGGDQWKNRGERDAVVLFNKDIYGCDSPVVKQVMNHIMLKINVGDANTISIGNDPERSSESESPD
jgi:hypothetical protein